MKVAPSDVRMVLQSVTIWGTLLTLSSPTICNNASFRFSVQVGTSIAQEVHLVTANYDHYCGANLPRKTFNCWQLVVIFLSVDIVSSTNQGLRTTCSEQDLDHLDERWRLLRWRWGWSAPLWTFHQPLMVHVGQVALQSRSYPLSRRTKKTGLVRHYFNWLMAAIHNKILMGPPYWTWLACQIQSKPNCPRKAVSHLRSVKPLFKTAALWEQVGSFNSRS